MPDPISRTPFDVVTDPDPPEAPGRPPTAAPGVEEYAAQIKETADMMRRDRASLRDVNLMATAVRELRYCFKVFAAYRGKRKAAVFGSARTKPDHPAYRAAEAFGRGMAEIGWMVIT